ncbi:hypothetical protein Tco_0798626, partial [Tanacetum coccineum]
MDNSYEIFEAKISVRSKLHYLQKSNDCTLVEQAKKPTCSTYVQIDAVINQDVPLVQEMQDVLGNSKVIDTLTTTFKSTRKHAEVVASEVVNCETNLVECPVVEKDVGVLRVAVVSCEMKLFNCPVVQEDIFDLKNLTYRDTQPSTMEHLVNACAFFSPPLTFYDSLKADKFVEPAQASYVTNDTDDYMEIKNDPSKYCLDNLTIGIEEDTQNGELTDGNMNLDKFIADVTKSENKSLQMIKASKVTVVKGDGKPVLGKVFEAIRRIKKPGFFKQTSYMQQRPETPQVKKKRKRFNNLKPIDFSLSAPSDLDGSQETLQPFKEVYFSLNQPQTHWALAELQIRTGVIVVYDLMAPHLEGLGGVEGQVEELGGVEGPGEELRRSL